MSSHLHQQHYSPASASRVLLPASRGDSNNNKLLQGQATSNLVASTSSASHKNNNTAQGASKMMHGTPSSSSSSSSSSKNGHSHAAVNQTPTRGGNIDYSAAGGDGKENINNNTRTPMVSAIPTRLKLQQNAVTGSPISNEPTMQELLAQSPGVIHTRSAILHSDAASKHSNNNNDPTSMTGMASWRKGQGFKQWEQELLKSAEVRRKADVAQLYFLDYYFDLISYIGARRKRTQLFKNDAAQRQITSDAYASEWKSYTGRERALLRKRRAKLRLQNFHIITQVGQGGYGEVYLARKKDTQEVVALKKMKKSTLAKMDEIKHVLVERDILTATKTPWLVALLYAFQDPSHIYLAMEYVPGGDFRTLLNNSGVLKEEHARFYIAEMFCSVDALHKLGYIHRDLKPENFLIDKTGHIKLTDFGLAAGNLNPSRIESMKHKLDKVKDEDIIYRSTKEMRDIYKSIRKIEPRSADSIVGSPDYMAIECMKGQAYTFSVDYWSLGCILFEFLAGYPPFSGATPEETWTNLKNWHKTLRRPHYDRPEDRIFNLSDNGWSAIIHLIADKSRRMSTLDEIKQHPFYAGIRWDTIRDTPAPFIPALDSEVDTGYFDNFEDPADMAKYAEVKEKQRNVDAVKEKEEPFSRGVWVGFTYKPRNGAQDNGGFTNLEDDDEAIQVMF